MSKEAVLIPPPHRGRSRRPSLTLSAVVLASVLLGAAVAGGCSSEDLEVSESPTSSTTLVPPGPDGPPEGTTVTVDANTASVDDLAAAFEAAGVPDPEQWAREVEEHRPYADDGWAHLRQELSRAGIDDDTLDRVTSTLTL